MPCCGLSRTNSRMDGDGMKKALAIGHRLARNLRRTLRSQGLAGLVTLGAIGSTALGGGSILASQCQQTFPVAPFLRLTLNASLPQPARS